MTEEFIKIIGVGCVTALTAILLKSTKPELAFAVSVVGTLVILLMALGLFRGAANILYTITSLTGLDNSLLKMVLKILNLTLSWKSLHAMKNHCFCYSLYVT